MDKILDMLGKFVRKSWETEYHSRVMLFKICDFVTQVTVLRMVDLDESEDSSEESEDKSIPPPKPYACAKVCTSLM